MRENIVMPLILSVGLVLLVMVTSSAGLEITLDKLSPQPVEPGQDLTLSITLSNDDGDAESVTLTIDPDSYIILKDRNDRVINEGRIIKYGAIAETYLLHIDPDAYSGIYEIDFIIRWMRNSQIHEINKTFNVVVQGMPQMAISNITINPERISPKDNFNITFLLSNEGTGIALDSRITAITSSLPFVPSGADTKIIKNLRPGESDKLNFGFHVKDKTEISSYSIPVKMDYKDESGRNSSFQSFVGVKILGKAELSIESIRIEPQNPVEGDPVTIIMRIENSGTGDAKSVKVDLNMPFEGMKTAFLGKIKPDDDAPGVFRIYPVKSGDTQYSASIEFEDDLGNHTVNQTLVLNIGKTNKNGTVISVIIVLLAIAVLVLYSHRSKNK